MSLASYPDCRATWTGYLTLVVIAHSLLNSSDVFEPWYQYFIGVCAGVAAPIVGYAIGGQAAEVATRKPAGFAGIPRAHFLWLWFPAYWYSAAMIPSLLNIYFNGILSWRPPWTITALYVIPLVCFGYPLLGGLSLLSGEAGTGRPILRQTLGVIVLVAGWGFAFSIHLGIVSLVNAL